MDFKKRLDRAVTRGQQIRDAQGRAEAEKALDEEELRTIHSQVRIELSEHIESCLRDLADHFPGFRFETVVNEQGWGAKVNRDDYAATGRTSQYSRLEMVIRPFSSTHIVELTAKATVRNKEIFNRSHYQFLAQRDADSFRELIDLWILEYAEKYSSMD